MAVNLELEENKTTSDNLNDEDLIPRVLSVRELLLLSNITFPDYQRPYKWTVKNVTQLINDIITFKKKPAYRLGTIVIHKDNEKKLNIVDGQQRTISLFLIFKAIYARFIEGNLIIENVELKQVLENINQKMPLPSFSNTISIQNIKENYIAIERLVAIMDEDIVSFLLNKCEFVRFILKDISEAFQFFDAQNSRGKDLDPHDLLKAFHLREFSATEKKELDSIVDTWENTDTDALVNLFGKYLFRIIGWAKGYSSRYFTKNEVGLFKGITLGKIDNYPLTKALRITHFYIEAYNKDPNRNIDLARMEFPFQLDQSIINGKRFFEMAGHYQVVIDSIKVKKLLEQALTPQARKIIYAINNYEGRRRIGDKYVKVLFDCALIFYYDKFGFIELSRVIEKIFIWSYKVRLKQQSVFLSTADKYVLEQNIFVAIKDAIHPEQVLNYYISQLEEVRVKNHKSMNFAADEDLEISEGSLINIFKELKYYSDEQ